MNTQSELQKKSSQLDLMELLNEPWIDRARRAARRICHLNLSIKKYGPQYPNCVTMDMVRELMGIETDEFGLNSNNRNGSVFRKGFESVGFVASQVPGSHGNLLRIWRIADESR